MNNPSILILSPGFAANEQDHNCIPVLQLLVREFLTKGIDIQIVTLEYPFTDQAYNWHGAKVFPCNGRNRRWLVWRTLLRATRFCNQILDTRPNTTQIHSFWLGWAAFLGERVAQQRDLPHFTTLMGQDVLPQNKMHLRALTAARCARLIAVSEFQNRMLEKTTGFRARQVIPWGVSASEIPKKHLAEKKLDVLGVGNLIPVKNWDKWLKIIALVKQSKPEIRAELIGGGPERARLEKLARSLGLEHHVHFSGSLPRPEVLIRMAASRVLLHTADYESYGFVFAEAVMNGMKIVSTPVGIASELGGDCADSVGELANLVIQSLVSLNSPDTRKLNTMSMVAERYLACADDSM